MSSENPVLSTPEVRRALEKPEFKVVAEFDPATDCCLTLTGPVSVKELLNQDRTAFFHKVRQRIDTLLTSIGAAEDVERVFTPRLPVEYCGSKYAVRITREGSTIEVHASPFNWD